MDEYNKYDRRSHRRIFDVVPIEMIKVVSKTVREAPVETVKSKDGMVVYFLLDKEKNLNRREK